MIRKIIVGVDVVEFAGFSLRGDDAAVFGAFIVTGEQGVLAV